MLRAEWKKIVSSGFSMEGKRRVLPWEGRGQAEGTRDGQAQVPGNEAGFQLKRF